MLNEIDWGSLRHANGPATDTPAYLADLTSADPEARWAAVDHLDDEVLHQGYPESATAPAAQAVTRLLATGDVDAAIEAALIEFLGGVAEAVGRCERGVLPELRAELEQAVRQSWPVLLRHLDEGSADRRIVLDAAVAHVRTGVLAAEQPSLVARVRGWTGEDSGDRAFWVRRLGMLDADVRDFLRDADPLVRVCAALAPGGGEQATEVLITGLSLDAGLLAAAGSAGLFTLAEVITAVLARIEDFARIAGPAAEIVRRESWAGFGSTWGPLLLAAFRGARPEALTTAQREVLAALVDNAEVWNYRNGSIGLVFREAGLPFERQACARLAAG